MEFKNMTLVQLREGLLSGTCTQEQLYTYFAKRIEQYNPDLNAFTTLPNTSDISSVTKNQMGLGLPIAVKETFCEKGIRTTAGSKMLSDFVPPYESTVTDRMKQSGFVSFGKTNMDEFALGGSGENSAFGATRNPWDTTRIPGGTSSGSAAAVAAGLVPAALGTDTGGSIRQPASMCGVVGFKPGYGRNSRFGVIAAASSLDTPGYLTKTVRDAGILYEVTAGNDKKDATSLQDSVSINPTIWEKKDLRGITVGVPKEYFIDGIDPGVRREIDFSLEKLKELGASIREVSLPHTNYGISAYYIINPAEVASNLARYDGIRYGYKTDGSFDIAKNRTEGLGPEAQRRSMVGSFVLSSGFYDAYYKKASDVRELIRQDFREAFELVDIIVTPTAPTVAWKIGSKGDDPLKLYLEDIFTVPASLAGIPGITVPVGYASPEDDTNVELPVGLQILGPVLGEEKCLMVGHVLEGAMKEKIDAKKPKIF